MNRKSEPLTRWITKSAQVIEEDKLDAAEGIIARVLRDDPADVPSLQEVIAASTVLIVHEFRRSR